MSLHCQFHPKYLNQYYSLNRQLRKRSMFQKLKILLKYLLLRLRYLLPR